MNIALLLLFLLSGCSFFGLGQTNKPNNEPIENNFPPVPTPPAGMKAFTDTWNNIHLAQVFTYRIDNPASVAQYYDFVWSVPPDQLAAFRSGNPNAILSYYIPFHRDAGTYADPGLGRQHDLNYWKSTHPDWILYQCDRTTPAREDSDTVPNIGFDFTNPAVINWQVQTYAKPASEAGYDALAADNLNLKNGIGACGHYDANGKWVQRYTGSQNDPQWREDVLTWVTQMQKALYSLPHPMMLVPNFGLDGLPANDPIVQQILLHVDGILDEGGFTNYGDNYVTGSDWTQLVQLMKEVQNNHKAYYLLNAFKTDTLSDAQIQWALASYLMGKEHNASIFISRSQDYGASLRYPEYSANIGSPQGEMYQDQQVYWRKYSGGLVVVNPSASNSYTVNLNGSYTNINGQRLGQTLTLPAHSGMILLH